MQPCRLRLAGRAHARQDRQSVRGKLVERGVAEPIHVAQHEAADEKRLARTDDDAPVIRIELHHIERLALGDADAAALADGEMDDAVMAAEHAAVDMHDIAGLRRAGLQLGNDVGIAAARHEADVLAVGLFRDLERELAGDVARLRLGQVAERETDEVELLGRGGEEEIALVARKIRRSEQAAPAIVEAAGRNIVPGRERRGAEFARRREQVGELDRLVAGDAGDRRLARHIALGEPIDDRGAEAILVVEHIVRNTEPLRDAAGIMDVLARAAGARPVRGLAMIVELHRHADDVIALALQHSGDDRGIDPARHRDDNPIVFGATRKVEAVEHGCCPCLLGLGHGTQGPARTERRRAAPEPRRI